MIASLNSSMSITKDKRGILRSRIPESIEQPRVVLAHVNVAPFVQQAARAFHERGFLARFLTTLVDRPTSFWQRLACGAARLARFDLASQLRRRAVTEVS